MISLVTLLLFLRNFSFLRLGLISDICLKIFTWLLIITLLLIITKVTGGIGLLLVLIPIKFYKRINKLNSSLLLIYKSYINNDLPIQKLKSKWNLSAGITEVLILILVLTSLHISSNEYVGKDLYFKFPLTLIVILVILQIPQLLYLNKINQKEHLNASFSNCIKLAYLDILNQRKIVSKSEITIISIILGIILGVFSGYILGYNQVMNRSYPYYNRFHYNYFAFVIVSILSFSFNYLFLINIYKNN